MGLPAVLVLLFTGCAGLRGESNAEVRIKGSDTMVLLNRRLAAAFMMGHPGTAVVVEGGGSATGVQALLEGSVDIAAASRPVEGPEVGAVFRRYGTLGVRFLVAEDPFSVYLNPSNPVRDLSVEQLRAIFAGKVTSWRELGGEDLEIHVITRPPTSGSHRFFQLHVLLGGAYAARAATLARTRDIVGVVRKDPAAIGYGGRGWARGVRCARVDGVAPTPGAVREGRYPLTRYLTFYTARPPSGAVRRFIDWCLGPEGQAVVRKVGYVPLWLPGGAAGVGGCEPPPAGTNTTNTTNKESVGGQAKDDDQHHDVRGPMVVQGFD